MGTNYTVATKDKELHIGKSSSGWVFSLRVHEDCGILSLYDWLPILLDKDNRIFDEYGSHITAEELLKRITVRSRAEPVNWSKDDWEMNHAEPGPNNLVRHRQISEYGRTITHGEGTWDYMDYEFF